MGFASYLEDLINRYYEGIAEIEGNIKKSSDEKLPITSLDRQAQSVLLLCRNLLQEVHETLDLMTDPEVDISREYERLRKEVREKNIRIVDMKSKTEFLISHHLSQLEELEKYYERQMASLEDKHQKNIARAKKEAVDEAERKFIEFGDEFREELGY
jgi:hypothetical protein